MARFARPYRGPVRAVIADWAGTTVDFGSVAPAQVFREVFAAAQVPISLAEARGPMGAEKRRHIELILAAPAVAARWRAAHGNAPGDDDVDRLYAAFNRAILDLLPRYADLTPGVLETAAALKARGIALGTNSGYSAEMMAVLAPAAARQGFHPDCVVSASDVPAGRPAPYMTFRCLERLGVYPVAAAIKVDDTVSGIEEGLNAGVWAVGVTVTGNEVGLPAADWTALPEAERAALRTRAEARLLEAGAHYVIDGFGDLMPIVEAIGARLAAGERP